MDRLVFIMLLAFGAWATLCSQISSETKNIGSGRQTTGAQAAIGTGADFLVRYHSKLNLPGVNREEKIHSFLQTRGADVGFSPSSSFKIASEKQDFTGGYHLKAEQVHQGVPVFDGHLNFHFDNNNQLSSVNGKLVNVNQVDVEAVLSHADAATFAKQWASDQYPGRPVNVVGNQQYLYQEGLTKGQAGDVRLVYYLELTNQQDIRDYLIVDAINGRLIEHIPAMCHLLNREVYQGSLDQMIWKEGDNYPANLDSWQQNQLTYTQSFYNLFANTFQYMSFDNAEGVMRIVDQAGFLECPNANWNGLSTNYCSAMAADDVVGHEWAHAYTEYTSNLLLIWQSGAINEAYADIWGETMDILNGDADVDVLRTNCDNSSRWKIAEATGILSGPLRDMYEPQCYNSPGKLSDTEYHCSADGHEGVHTNSGIISHAYALLVDGGEYNGYSIDGIGLTKAAHIFWHTQLAYLSRTSDFKALADGLEAACQDLRGVNLPKLALTAEEVGLSNMAINAADSLTLRQVIAATEMRLDIAVCPDNEPALSPHATDWCNELGKVFYPFYSEDFEGDISAWDRLELPGDASSWVTRQWEWTDHLPANRNGKGMFGAAPNVGDCEEQANNGIIRLESPPIIIPDDIEGHVYLTFAHYFSLENGMDGANIKIQQDGGGWTKIPPSAFVFNGYNDILPLFGLTDNPMAGERVFTGANEGTTTGSWGITQIDLDIIGVRSGDEVVMRWEVGTNGCDGWEGWYIDNIKLGSCSSSALFPVDWLSFTAQHVQEGIKLEWITAREENNAGFTIERSTDGRVFEELAWVAGQGNTETPSKYTYLDAATDLGLGFVFYRLRQEDFNGQQHYSAIRELQLESKLSWHLAPNPVHHQLQLNLEGQWPENTRIEITNLQGQMIASYSKAEALLGVFSVAHLPAGVYLVQLSTTDYHQTQRFVKT
ncbi:MAG: M4 family metallopeptidase [Bacteroidota bacterium]